MPAPSNAQPPAVPSLVPQGPHDGKRPMTLNRLFTLIGSAPSARLYLPSKAVSRCHAVIINADTGFFVRDLASRTMVLVNGEAVREADLRDGDVIQIGPFIFRLSDPDAGRGRPTPLAPHAAALEAEGLAEPLRLEDRLVLIGRRETADISLTENSASSAHAVLVATNGGHVVRDLNSRTGTFVNNVKIHEHVLQPGDTLRVGETTMRYARARDAVAVPAAPAAMPTAAPAAAAAKPAVAEPTVPEEGPGDRANPAPERQKNPAPVAPPALARETLDEEAGDDAPPGSDSRTGAIAVAEDAPQAATEDSPEDAGDGSSLGAGASLDSPGETADGKPDGPGQHAIASASDSAADAAADAVATPGRDEGEAIPLAREEDLFEDVAAHPETGDPATPGTAAAAPVEAVEVAEPVFADSGTAAPSPSVPSPEVSRPAPAVAAEVAPERIGIAAGGHEAPEPSRPVAGAARETSRPAPPSAPPLPPPVAPAASSPPGKPAAPPARPAWGNRARPVAPPGSSPSPRDAGSPAGDRAARPAPPAPPPAPPPGRRGAEAKPPAALKPTKPAPPRPDRPRNPFDRVPGADSESLEEMPVEESDPGDETVRP